MAHLIFTLIYNTVTRHRPRQSGVFNFVLTPFHFSLCHLFSTDSTRSASGPSGRTLFTHSGLSPPQLPQGQLRQRNYPVSSVSLSSLICHIEQSTPTPMTMKRHADEHTEHPSKRPLSASASHHSSFGSPHFPASPNLSTDSPSPPQRKEVLWKAFEGEKVMLLR